MNPAELLHNFREKSQTEGLLQPAGEEAAPSVVQVYFPERGRTLAYYNDRFALRVGDMVFVEGKLEGLRGRVTAVNTSFDGKAEDYKRVIRLADTRVTGQFYQADAYLITFDPKTLPWKQFLSWTSPSQEDTAEYYAYCDGKGVSIRDLSQMDATEGIFQRGVQYYHEKRVGYLCLEGTQGRAMVQGTRSYGVEFQYQDGQARNLACDCPCGYICKHEVAVLLQLREALEWMEERYSAQWSKSGYFAMVRKPLLYAFAVDGNPEATLQLG